MGVIRWLDRIDPGVWERAVQRIDQRGEALLEKASAAAFLQEFGRDSSSSILEFLDDAEDESARPTLLNGLLQAAVTEESWYLDKSFNGLASLVPLLPGGKALTKIIDFKGIDVQMPEACSMTDSGLYGCCSSAALADCTELAQRLGTASAVEAALGTRSTSLVDRLLRGHRIRSAVELIRQDYCAGYWETLCRAVLATSDRGHYLGLGMSP